MFRAIFPTLVGVAVTIAAGSATRAGVVNNGGFEDGTFLPEWQTIGNTSIQTDAFGTGPAAGDFQALLSTDDSLSSPPVSDSALETFLDIPLGTLDALSGEDVVEGSAIKQSISGNAGEELSFSWNFLTNNFFDDFAFWTLVSAHDGQVLASANSSSFNPSPTGVFASETGYMTATFTLPTNGTFLLGFGVVDVVDDQVSSGLLVDQVNFGTNGSTPVIPEPTSLALLVIGAAGILLGSRRRRGALA